MRKDQQKGCDIGGMVISARWFWPDGFVLKSIRLSFDL